VERRSGCMMISDRALYYIIVALIWAVLLTAGMRVL
jgi:hypothetical protein